MPFNGSGTYVRSYSWASEAAAGNPISSSKMDTEDNGFATGLSNCVTRDGQSPALNNLPMGGYRITGIGNATQPTDALNMQTADSRYIMSDGTSLTMGTLGIDAQFYLTLVSSKPTINLDSTSYIAYDRTGSSLAVTIGGTACLTLTASSITVPGTITAAGIATANGAELGWRDLVANSQTSAYTLALTDRGKMISITTGGVTIPANGAVAFPIGTTIVVVNNSGSAQSIAITTDTLRLAGTTGTGARSIAAYGIATLLKIASTTWVISGVGVS